MCLLTVSDESSIDCLNCSQKRAHVSIPPDWLENDRGKFTVADEAIGATVVATSQASVIVTFVVEVAKCL